MAEAAKTEDQAKPATKAKSEWPKELVNLAGDKRTVGSNAGYVKAQFDGFNTPEKVAAVKKANAKKS